MRVMMLGFRGFPEVQGGVEKHAENLCPLLNGLGCDIEAVVRSPYVAKQEGEDDWHGVRIRRLWAPRSRNLEAAIHSLVGVLLALVRRPDILHIHGIGPALWTPIARLFGLRVIFTHHGADYERQKWGRFAKWVLRTGERCGVLFAHRCIAISPAIAEHVQQRYGRKCDILPNGVVLPAIPDGKGALASFGLETGKYALLVSRLVPEKRHFDLIEAFQQATLPDWKLVLVGDADHPDEYSNQLQRIGESTPNVVLAGFQTGEALAQLYTYAGVFVLPSSHEGLPIALLEALSYGTPVIASDIPANRSIGLSDDVYFPVGDIESLRRRLLDAAAYNSHESARVSRRHWITRRYSWNEVARGTLNVYLQCVTMPRARWLTKYT